MWSEFKKFAFKGNVMDMAVGVMIGAAFNGIVSSIVNDVFMPLFGLIFDTTDLGTKFIVLKGVEGVDLAGMTAADAAAAGATVLSYGKFLASIINFFIIALVIFFMVKLINKLKELGKNPRKRSLQKSPEFVLTARWKLRMMQSAARIAPAFSMPNPPKKVGFKHRSIRVRQFI